MVARVHQIEQEILRILSSGSGCPQFVRVNLSAIARQVGVHQSTVSRVALAMEREGLITRKRPGWYHKLMRQPDPEPDHLTSLVLKQQQLLEERLVRIETMLAALAPSLGIPSPSPAPIPSPHPELIEPPSSEVAAPEETQQTSRRTRHTTQAPVEKIIELYKDILPGLPAPRGVSESNKRLIRARWDEYRKAGGFATYQKEGADEESAGLAFFREFFETVGRSPFLMGEKTDFKASLPWLMGPVNFSKVLDGAFPPAKQNIVPFMPRASENKSKEDSRHSKLRQLEETLRAQIGALENIERNMSTVSAKARLGLEEQADKIRQQAAITESLVRELRRDLGLPLPGCLLAN